MDQDNYIKMMQTWSDAAKSCGQLATATMFLPLFFLREIKGLDKAAGLANSLNPWFIACWCLLATTIAISMVYQLTAARLIGGALAQAINPPLFPRTQFWLMTIALVLGVVSFIIGAAHGLT